MTEPTYTLAEAKAFLARKECATWGHDYEHMLDQTYPRDCSKLLAVGCGRCGQTWNVTMRDEGGRL